VEDYVSGTLSVLKTRRGSGDDNRGFHGFGNSFGNTISSGNSLGSWILGKDVGWKFVL
jgi:hypothetical protein